MRVLETTPQGSDQVLGEYQVDVEEGGIMFFLFSFVLE